jgi:molybdopterin biosynthesis enzyme MoaB
MAEPGKNFTELRLLEKTEIWIRPLVIREVNLNLVAERVAEVLNLKEREVLVVDVREDLITLDILKKTVRAEEIIGRKEALLRAVATVPGISLLPETEIHSEGVLGLIDIEDPALAGEILNRMERMGREISARIEKRGMVFPSGFEIQQGLIQDTNSPYIRARLTEEGYDVRIGKILDDNLDSIVAALNRTVSDGFGLIITTGGVGAESKDRLVEALLALDPEAATPYLIRYEKGKGRHEKDGVRIGVAYLKPSLIVALPGPHEEAKMGIEVVIDGLKKGWSKEEFARSLAERYVAALKRIHHAP